MTTSNYAADVAARNTVLGIVGGVIDNAKELPGDRVAAESVAGEISIGATVGGVVFRDLTREQCDALQSLHRLAVAGGGGGGIGGSAVASAMGEPDPEPCELTDVAYMQVRRHLASLSPEHRAAEIVSLYVVNGLRFVTRDFESGGFRRFTIEGLPDKGRALVPDEALETLVRVLGESSRQRKLG